MAGALNARPAPELSGGWAGNAPLDGGGLLRAIIWWRTHDRVKATVRADQAGQVFGTICVVGGLYLFFTTQDPSWVWIALVGWFLAGAATTQTQQAVLAGRLRGIACPLPTSPGPPLAASLVASRRALLTKAAGPAGRIGGATAAGRP